MFSPSEKITTRPGVFHVVGVTQIFCIKMAEIEFNVAHQRKTCCRLCFGADLRIKIVKATRQFPVKVNKSASFIKTFCHLDRTAVITSNSVTSPPSGKIRQL